MIPYLVNIPFLKIPTFGVFMVLAFFWSTFLLWKIILMTSHKEEKVFDLMFISLGAGLFFSRLFYVIMHFNDFGFNILKFVLINGYPGLSLMGFVVGALVTCYIAAQMMKIDFFYLIDYTIPSAFLALGIGKMGALFSGAEIGTQTSFPVAIKYANMDGLRHLTPLYESIIFFIATFIAYKIIFSVRRQNMKKGANLHFFIWLFSLVFVAFEPIRDHSLTRFYGLSPYALFAVLLLLTETVYLLYYGRYLIFSWLNISNLKRFHGITIPSRIPGRAKEKASGRKNQDNETDN